MKILVTDPLAPKGVEALKRAGFTVEEKIGIGKYSPNEEEEPAEMMQIFVVYFFVDFSRYPGAK